MQLDENEMWLNTKEYTECGPQTDGTIPINGQNLTKSIQFKYMGSVVHTDVDNLPAAHACVNAA